MAVRIRRTGRVHTDGIKCLVYGKAGIGKTSLLGTGPKPFVISCEAGMLALQDKNLPYTEVTTPQEIYEVYDWLHTRKGARYETVGLDSISEVGEVVLSDLKKTIKDGRQVYGELGDEMSLLIRKFRDIKGKNVVFTAKQKRIDDDGIQVYIPSMPGKTLTDGLPFFFDEVFYMDLHEKDDGTSIRVLRTDVGFEHEGKDRSGKLKKMELPNLTHIFNKIKSA